MLLCIGSTARAMHLLSPAQPGLQARHRLPNALRAWAPTITSAWLTFSQPHTPLWHLSCCSLPDGAIPHGSKIKIKMRHPGGWWVDRIPAWARWATGESRLVSDWVVRGADMHSCPTCVGTQVRPAASLGWQLIAVCPRVPDL